MNTSGTRVNSGLYWMTGWLSVQGQHPPVVCCRAGQNYLQNYSPPHCTKTSVLMRGGSATMLQVKVIIRTFGAIILMGWHDQIDRWLHPSLLAIFVKIIFEIRSQTSGVPKAQAQQHPCFWSRKQDITPLLTKQHPLHILPHMLSNTDLTIMRSENKPCLLKASLTNFKWTPFNQYPTLTLFYLSVSEVYVKNVGREFSAW